MPIGIAILGAGIFAREEQLPAVEACAQFSLKAIYSRSQESAEKLAKTKQNVDAYYDEPKTTEKSLHDLLQRKDIEAVIIGLPITSQPAVIETALAAGKHVLSEKPIGPDVSTAKRLIARYQEQSQRPIWSVAENFRFVKPLQYATEALSQLGGDVTTFSMTMMTLITENDKFYQTAWRQIPDYQGGFLLDGDVHFVAGLRAMLGAACQHIAEVASFTNLHESRLAPVDTVHALLKLANGRSGTFILSFGTAHKPIFEIEVVTTNGRVTMTPTEVRMTGKGGSEQAIDEKATFEMEFGVKKEVEAFAQSIGNGESDRKATPEEALADLELLEAMLNSGKAQGSVMTVMLPNE